MKPSVAFIGFGEAAAAFAKGWAGRGPDALSAFDIKTNASGEIRQQKLADYATFGVKGCETAGEAIAGANIVFSLVTADQASTAAQSTVGYLPDRCLFLDCNSCAPETKRRNADVIDHGGGRYVDVAIMAPVYPGLHETPVLVSGNAAGDAVEAMKILGMRAELVEGGIGAASSIKMVRSIMVKGLEALTAECVLAGHKAGIIDTVLESLEKTYPGFGWQKRTAHALERMIVHGARRAAEMREVTLMLDALGLDSAMSRATVEWQQAIGDLQLSAGEDSCQLRAQSILKALSAKADGKNN